MAADLEEYKVSEKHAFLIMAHSDFGALEKLLSALDDVRNDIYLHVDKKSPNVDCDRLRYCVKKAGLFFAKRRNIYWGHSSVVKCEISLLEMATAREHYHYYHLLSGVDFPLKSQDYIHDFFKDKNLEYVTYFYEKVPKMYSVFCNILGVTHTQTHPCFVAKVVKSKIYHCLELYNHSIPLTRLYMNYIPIDICILAHLYLRW